MRFLEQNYLDCLVMEEEEIVHLHKFSCGLFILYVLVTIVSYAHPMVVLCVVVVVSSVSCTFFWCMLFAISCPFYIILEVDFHAI